MGAFSSKSKKSNSHSTVKSRIQLPSNLETGDLVLFRTKATSASCTRFCTDGKQKITKFELAIHFAVSFLVCLVDWVINFTFFLFVCI